MALGKFKLGLRDYEAVSKNIFTKKNTELGKVVGFKDNHSLHNINFVDVYNLLSIFKFSITFFLIILIIFYLCAISHKH